MHAKAAQSVIRWSERARQQFRAFDNERTSFPRGWVAARVDAIESQFVPAHPIELKFLRKAFDRRVYS